ncbi:MAG: hypothetical protein JST84_03965 [Acidobacteria bacterium]|nr:hypothetical protein [Acidobacteriota bacterium]
MKLSVYAIFAVLFWVSTAAFAQDEEPLKRDWLAQDVKALQLLARLQPVEAHTLEDLKCIWGKNTGGEERELGFGAQRVRLTQPNGYTHFYLDLFIFHGRIGFYELGVSGSRESWPRIRTGLIAAWWENGGGEYEEDDGRLVQQRTFPAVFQAYQQAVAAALGELKPVTVPAALRDSYEYLLSPLENSYVGKGGCGYGGEVPAGRKAMEALRKAGRMDLIENVLRGYNPGGRVYAALAFLEQQRRGVWLPPEVQETIRKLSALKITITTCEGCIVSQQWAKGVFRTPEKY